MKEINRLHVVRCGRGGWNVKNTRANRASRHCIIKTDAINYAKYLAEKRSGVLYIHGSDGKVQEEISYEGG